jgi:hypothetical protein
MSEVRECPPPMLETSMGGPLGGDARDLGAPTTYAEDVDGGAPWEVRPPSVVQRCVVTYICSIDRSNSAHGSRSHCA